MMYIDDLNFPFLKVQQYLVKRTVRVHYEIQKRHRRRILV